MRAKQALACKARKACRALVRRTAESGDAAPSGVQGQRPWWGASGRSPRNFFEKWRCFSGPGSDSSNTKTNKTADVKFS